MLTLCSLLPYVLTVSCLLLLLLVFLTVPISTEFEDVKVREEELDEMDSVAASACPIGKPILENKEGKINMLLQSVISDVHFNSFTLISDQGFVKQSAGRIVRALFEIVCARNWTAMSLMMLQMAKQVDRQVWNFQTPLRQFAGTIPMDVLAKLEGVNASLDKLDDMSASDIGRLIRNDRSGGVIKKAISHFPRLELDVSVQPITRTIVRIEVTITFPFEWSDRINGSVEPWYIWVTDPNGDEERNYHTEYFLLYKKMVMEGEPHKLTLTIPIFEPVPPQYILHAVSDRWLGAETIIPIPLQGIVLPDKHVSHTELLNLTPLPLACLGNPDYESLYRFQHFNAVQTQCFHTAYHTDTNMLVGAPTGSGKTNIAELAMLRLFNIRPKAKCVYIGPLKALVSERMKDWKVRMEGKLGRKTVELTGDYTPDMASLKAASIVVTTPEKWDGISRAWQQRSYVKDVELVVIDEIHLLGTDRGAILEVIVSRMRYIASHTDQPIRIVGLSTALANAGDIADWLGIDASGLFNFRPSVRPVPLEAHISGFPGKFYCPRMATMNKPCYTAILTHSPTKPTLVFVSSRRQTRLTALDLISYAIADETPHAFRRIDEGEMQGVLKRVSDPNLKHCLEFGIGMHHAGLTKSDRDVVEELFCNQMILVLVCTSTLAWGVNYPAHLVVIKGTEYFDADQKRYVDFPITDVLQMMGRAGRPQFDTSGKAVILVHEPKKAFYRKFLYEPFPVESSLAKSLHNHVNAEIVGGTIASRGDAVDYLTWTYFFRRLVQNPTYYGLEDTSLECINAFLEDLGT